MRNLKKTLCLVLALVFVLGLCTVGAADEKVAFSDAEKIQYVTQVNAMTGLGILIGYPDGSFKPAQDVTRAEAAKIISYVMVGTDEVEKWPAKQVFSDVPADHWAAKYITFCEYNNVINGYGNGKFGPNDPVTKAQLAKMLLAACGYGQKDEFIGDGWDQNVAALAFECKVLKDIKGTADWNSPASREETALMCYNTMMRTFRVVLSDDTTSYEPAWINGEFNVTFARSPWGLQSFTGIVYASKANMKNAKGTTIRSGNVSLVVETEYDADPSILGHEVTVYYREEGVSPNQKNVAYFLDDECREVSGTEANYKDLAAYAVTVDKGFVYSKFDAVVTKGLRYQDRDYLYILNEDDVIVGCKYPDGFDIVPVTVNAFTGVASVIPVGGVAPETVSLPEGVKHGDLVCLYQCGEVYTVLPTTKVENVAITQKQMILFNYVQYYSYNDGNVTPTWADNVTHINLASLTCMNPQELVVISGTTAEGIRKYEPVLKVGYTYTLYFDAEGGCFAYGDERPTTEVALPYVMYVTDFIGHDIWHTEQNFAQVLRIDGTIDKILLDGPTSGLTKGDIVYVRSLGYKSQLIPAPSSEAANRVTIPMFDPQYDYSNTTYCYHNNGELGGLVYFGSMYRPAFGATVSMTFKVVKIGTVWVRVVSGVWFYQPDTTVNTDSFIYITNNDVKQQQLIDGRTQNFYNGYLDGAAMDDLRIAEIDPATGMITYDIVGFNDTLVDKYQGFNSYAKNDKGIYILQPIPAGDGSATGVRNIYLVDADSAPKDIPSNAYCFYLNGKLWVMDNNGVRQGIDIANTKFVRIAGYSMADQLAGYPFPYQMPLDSINAIQTLLQSHMMGADGYTYTFKLNVAFVERVNIFGHFIGGNTIYVTGIEVATKTDIYGNAVE